MGITINSNIASLQAQRELSKTTQGLRKTFERLSSGLRIVRASDDAAGLSIASSLKNDNRVFTQGIRNLNDGISYLNIADGAIDQLKSIVIRCRELAAQAANGTMTSVQRSAIDQEADALSRECNRILATTKFNGSRVFDAENADVQVQCGYGVNEAISVRTGEGVITTETQRVSTSSSGGQGGAASSVPSISADGRYVAFSSGATNLVTGDTNGISDVFVKDLQTGVTIRVSTSSSGTEASSGSSQSAFVSADGRYVAFNSSATNLVPGDTNGQTDIFVKDLQTGATSRVNTSSFGVEASGGSSNNPSISADGRYVAFSSGATNLVPGDTNGQSDIFLKDLQTGTTIRINTSSSGTEATGGLSASSLITADGRYVSFYSNATNLVPGDSNSAGDIFVKDVQTGAINRVSTNSFGAEATGGSSNASISADGRFITFQSTATNLISGDTNGRGDIFVKDLETGVTTRVNIDSSGVEASGGDSFYTSISADGRFVAFISEATNLVSGDTNGLGDIFVRDLQASVTTRVSLSAFGEEGVGGIGSVNPAISADGRVVAFTSYSPNLVPGDTNANSDVFAVQNTAVSYAAGFSSVVRPLAGIRLNDRILAQMAQSTLDDYLDELNVAAGFIGSSMSRFSVAITTLGTRTENIEAAASRIMDVDVADESSQLTRRNILQQAASAVLAQANQQPQIALSLLGG